jgi:hypothetical protein
MPHSLLAATTRGRRAAATKNTGDSWRFERPAAGQEEYATAPGDTSENASEQPGTRDGRGRGRCDVRPNFIALSDCRHRCALAYETSRRTTGPLGGFHLSGDGAEHKIANLLDVALG